MSTEAGMHGAAHVEGSRSVRDRLRAGLRQAMRARDKVATPALRATLGAIDNAEAVPLPATGGEPVVGRAADVARRELSEQQVAAIVRAEHDERIDAAELYERLDRSDEAATLRAEAATLRPYLSST